MGQAEPSLRRARELHAAGRLREAEREYGRLIARNIDREAALDDLATTYLQQRRPLDALQALVALTEAFPDSLEHCARLGVLLEKLGRRDAAIGHYRRLLKRCPQLAAGHFNLGLLYRREQRYREALEAYDEALRLGIRDPQEVYSNKGMVYSEMRDARGAAGMYEQALAVDPGYVPALFNRAGLYEETGDRERAVELYRQILGIDPRHAAALARLAYASPVTPAEAGIVETLQSRLEDTRSDAVREMLLFALGKALDDLGRYDEAFGAFTEANRLGRERAVRYDRRGAERAVERLMDVCEAGWIAGATLETATAPVFICGMLRSGSTLLERLLAGHPRITPGGELPFVPRLVARKLAPYPERLADVTREELAGIAADYTGKVNELFSGGIVTDKRPDNFLYLGVLAAIFPRARFIHTLRDPLDNCLSIYFQHLGDELGYATDLDDAAHYFDLHQRLMNHWKDCFGERILTVSCERLVERPEPVLRELLAFLGLEFDARSLEPAPGGLVQTASIWQVRERVNTRSRGRWQNYEKHLRHLRERWTAG